MVVESVTSELVAKALDLMSLKHKLIAANVANIGVSGYTNKHLDFSSVMDEIQSKINLNGDAPSIKNYLKEVDLSTFISVDENPPVLEDQMIHMTENTLRYESLVKANSELGAILKSAVFGGRA